MNEYWRCQLCSEQSCCGYTHSHMVGIVLWSAPEVLEGKGEYGKAADVYSFGIVMFECWTREAPFQGVGAPGRLQVRTHILEGGRPVIPVAMGEPPGPYADLMQRCWHEQPTSRPTFAEVVETLEEQVTRPSMTSLGAESSRFASEGTQQSDSAGLSMRSLFNSLRWLKPGTSADRRHLDAPLLPISADSRPGPH